MSANGKFGRYEIISELGRGAMGVVYKARDPVLHRTVAIKTIDMTTVALEERAAYESRFYLEAKAIARLTHPNIVAVYDFGHEGNSIYMTMEFLEGIELRKLYGEKRPLPIKQAVEIAAQVAEGLGCVYEAGIVHRDIKPANIMVLRNGTVKLTDFGIARSMYSGSMEVKTQTGTLLGSPRYIAPEVILGNRADGRSDIFSLGVILYEMLTGVAPFTGDSISALMYQTTNHSQVPPSNLMPGIPPILDFIVTKSLAKKPSERYQDARDTAHDLRACLTELHVRDEKSDLRAELEENCEQALRTGATSTPAADDAAEEEVTAALRTQPLSQFDVGLHRFYHDEVIDPAARALAEPATHAEATPETDSVTTLRIARSFDSFEATQRLVVGDVGDEEAPDPALETTLVPRNSLTGWRAWLQRARWVSGWSRMDALVFAGGVGLAAVIALVIAFT